MSSIPRKRHEKIFLRSYGPEILLDLEDGITLETLWFECGFELEGSGI